VLFRIRFEQIAPYDKVVENLPARSLPAGSAARGAENGSPVGWIPAS
jgi:hypothetical protein